MLKRIRIRGYKSFDDIEIKLGNLVVLFGPNGSGKSNFLDALQLLSRLATARTLKEAFDPPYRGVPLESFAFERDGIKSLRHRETASFSIEVDVQLSNAVVDFVNKQISQLKQPKAADKTNSVKKNQGTSSSVTKRYLRYRIEVEIRPESGILRVSDEYLAGLTSEGDPVARPRPFLELVENQLRLRMEGQAHPTYHDRYLDHSIVSMPLYPPHYPHLAAIRKEFESWHFFYFEPRERMRKPSPVKEVRHIGLMGEELAGFLNTLYALDRTQFDAIEKALHVMIPSITGIDVGVDDLGQVELKLLEGDMPISARLVSEGTLRILGLLALGGAKDPPALIGFEEPETGVHPRRIRLVAELLRNRSATGDTQLIATTHSPIFPDLLEDENLYVCRKEKGYTRIEPFSSWGPLGRGPAIRDHLDAEEQLSVYKRVMRGDFDE
jgi:predicted ATPase